MAKPAHSLPLALALTLALLAPARAHASAARAARAATAAAGYAEAAARRVVGLSAAAYCPRAQVEAWTCRPCGGAPALTRVAYLDNETSAIVGYVGLAAAATPPEVVVAFRGSEGALDWLEDFDITQVPANATLPPGAAACAGCLLSRGFSVDTYRTVRAQLLAAVRATLAAAGPGATVVVTGHSLGGALAEVAALDLLAEGLPVSASYTFGTPRVGNAAWAAAWAAAAEAAMPGAHFRVVHALDPVPRLPPAVLLGYAHPPREVWYNNASSSFAVCSATNGEDASCSDSDVPLEARDHTFYLNVTLGEASC